jgi:hypothetical protein
MQFNLHWSAEISEVFPKAIETPGDLTSTEAWQMNEWLTSAMVDLGWHLAYGIDSARISVYLSRS